MKTRKIKDYQILFEQASSSIRGQQKSVSQVREIRKMRRKSISFQMRFLDDILFYPSCSGYQLSSLLCLPLILSAPYISGSSIPPSRATTNFLLTKFSQQLSPAISSSIKPPSNSKKKKLMNLCCVCHMDATLA